MSRRLCGGPTEAGEPVPGLETANEFGFGRARDDHRPSAGVWCDETDTVPPDVVAECRGQLREAEVPVRGADAQFFRGGFMFECVRRGKQRELIAFGGRCVDRRRALSPVGD